MIYMTFSLVSLGGFRGVSAKSGLHSVCPRCPYNADTVGRGPGIGGSSSNFFVGRGRVPYCSSVDLLHYVVLTASPYIYTIYIVYLYNRDNNGLCSMGCEDHIM